MSWLNTISKVPGLSIPPGIRPDSSRVTQDAEDQLNDARDIPHDSGMVNDVARNKIEVWVLYKEKTHIGYIKIQQMHGYISGVFRTLISKVC